VKIHSTPFLACLSAALVALCGSAYADDSLPLEITADKTLEWNDAAKTYVARGNALAKQGEMTLAADNLTAYYEGEDKEAMGIVRLLAEGHVVLTMTHPEGNDVATGDKATYDLQSGHAVLSGHRPKVVKGGKDTLEADEIQVQMDVQDGKALQTMNHAVATGAVMVMSGDYKAEGDKAVYTSATNTADMTGHVKIIQGKNIIEGETASANLTTHVSRVTGQKNGGRVKGVFYPGTGKKR